MAVTKTTTVRLGEGDVRLLDELAPAYGGRSGVIRAGLRLLAAQSERRHLLGEAVAAWEAEFGPIPEESVAEMRDYFQR